MPFITTWVSPRSAKAITNVMAATNDTAKVTAAQRTNSRESKDEQTHTMLSRTSKLSPVLAAWGQVFAKPNQARQGYIATCCKKATKATQDRKHDQRIRVLQVKSEGTGGDAFVRAGCVCVLRHGGLSSPASWR